MIEVLKQALEALDVASSCLDGYYIPLGKSTLPEIEEAITSLRQAIAEAEKQEPVACGNCNGSGRMVRDPDIGTDQECFVCEGSGVFVDTSPPTQHSYSQRQPLNNEQIGQAARIAHIEFCFDKHQTYEHALTRAIEAAHGIGEQT